MSASLADVPLTAMARLLQAALPAARLAIEDEAGRPLLGVSGGEGAEPWAGADDDGTWQRLHDGRVRCRRALVDPALVGIGRIGMTLPAEADLDAASALLEAAAACMQQLVAQERELGAMAVELGARYEELNLLYTLEDGSFSYDPKLGRSMLRRMLRDCSDFLGVSRVCLYAPLESLDLGVVPDDDGDGAPSPVWRVLREPLLAALRERNGPVVVDEPVDARRAGLPEQPAARVLAVPLHERRGAVCGLLAILNDLSAARWSNSDRKLLEVLAEQASRILQSNYDGVTGLLNRYGFEQQARQLLAGYGASPSVLAFLDLDGFRTVNDSAGTEAGDALLRRLADLLRGLQRRGRLFGNLGGDGFAALFAGGADLRAVLRELEQLQEQLARDGFTFGGKRFDVSVSVGVARIAGDNRDTAGALAAAEAAAGVARRYGRGQLRVYDPDDDAFTSRRTEAQWVPRIIDALADDGFTLHAQPIVPLSVGDALPHAEVLVRMKDGAGGTLAPGLFLPAAERCGLMPRLDRSVVAATLGHLRALPEAADLVLSVNISGQSLGESEFLGFVIDAVEATGQRFDRLCFEITETVAIADFQAAVRFIDALRRRGSRVSLDDFGSGLSSFGYLRRLPVDYLKIDGQIVRDIDSDRVNAAMVEAIHRIAVEMDLLTIAEFVEGPLHVEVLRRIGVHYAQGYAFGRPEPLAGLLERLVGAGIPDAEAG